MRQLPLVLLVFLLILCGVVCLLALRDAPANASGLTHPEYATMMQGADGVARHGGLLWAGWLFGAVIIAFFVGLMLLGLGAQATRARGFLLVGGVIVVATFTGVVATYRHYMREPTRALDHLFLGVPPPTAWMLYGIWFIPALFIILYIWKFHDWVWTPEKSAAFAQLMAQRNEEASSAPVAPGEGGAR